MDLSVLTGKVSEQHLRKYRPDYVARLEREGKLSEMRENGAVRKKRVAERRGRRVDFHAGLLPVGNYDLGQSGRIGRVLEMGKRKPSSKAPDRTDRSDASSRRRCGHDPCLTIQSTYWQRARLIALGVAAVIGAVLADMGIDDDRCGRVHVAVGVLHLLSHHGALLRLLAGIEPQGRRLHQVPFSARGRGKSARQDARPGAIAEVRHGHRRSATDRGDFRCQLSCVATTRDCSPAASIFTESRSTTDRI